MIFLVQFGINKHSQIFQRLQIALALRARAIFCSLWKICSCLFIPNCTRNHLITYTNITPLSSITIINPLLQWITYISYFNLFERKRNILWASGAFLSVYVLICACCIFTWLYFKHFSGQISPRGKGAKQAIQPLSKFHPWNTNMKLGQTTTHLVFSFVLVTVSLSDQNCNLRSPDIRFQAYFTAIGSGE